VEAESEIGEQGDAQANRLNSDTTITHGRIPIDRIEGRHTCLTSVEILDPDTDPAISL
jgi:hypothetical protein